MIELAFEDAHFQDIKNGKKTTIGKIDVDLQGIKKGETVVFFKDVGNKSNSSEKISVKVKDIKKFKDIPTMLKEMKLKSILPRSKSYKDGEKVFEDTYGEQLKNAKFTAFTFDIVEDSEPNGPRVKSKKNGEPNGPRVKNKKNGEPNGPNVKNKKNGESITLRYIDRDSIVLEEGDIVHRHMMDGDAILFNRQPTLHRMSMMCHIARIMKRGDTFRMNVADTKPYNADRQIVTIYGNKLVLN
jgi:ASC-1-like (ASCH) protein